MVASPPHFYQSDKSLLETVHGLKPEKSKHETFLEIEPVSKVIVLAIFRYVLLRRGFALTFSGHVNLPLTHPSLPIWWVHVQEIELLN